jgi:hypothetical protein
MFWIVAETLFKLHVYNCSRRQQIDIIFQVNGHVLVAEINMC